MVRNQLEINIEYKRIHLLSIGITGHRNLINSLIPIYEKKIFDEFMKLKEKYASITLYSSLADGADRIAVREAIKLNIDFIAVLPMPVDIYVSDFDLLSQNEFYDLLDKASRVIVIPYKENDLNQSKTINHDQRNIQYEAAGKFVVDHCNMLIALWDGTLNNLKGGTGEIVEYSKKLKKKLFHIQVERDML